MTKKNPKRIIFTGGGLGPVLEPNTGQCASKYARPLRGVDCEISRRSAVERNKASLVRV